MADFKKGDVVTLRSGSPRMTIVELDDFSAGGGPKDGAKCQWFEGTRPLERVFDSAALVISNDAPPVSRVMRG